MDTDSATKSKFRKRKAALNASFCVKKERNTIYQRVSAILQKPVAERSKDEVEFISNSNDVVEQITLRKAQRQKVKDRAQEYEDPEEVLMEKCKTLADAVINSNHLVVYTGAGISTAACIPDYRGSNGIWTLLQQGKDIGLHDLSQAEPTVTHMALYCLYRSGILKHIVSQNCDGLHLRSGIPRNILSEVHGNMYLEVCSKCKPSNNYLRLFDVTEYTARYSHETLRLCYKCGSPLKDTIVHFGERGKLQWPLNWDTACKQADKADVILCLGSSLKVLKRYPWLWCMDKPAKKRPKLYIVNLQWTPKDDHSTLKINGKCDAVIELMMSHIGLTIPRYVRALDPIFYHATVLHDSETHTTSRTPIDKNLPKQSVTTTTGSTSQDQSESEQSNNSSDKPSNDEKREAGASADDLTSSSYSNSVQFKDESPIKNVSVPDSCSVLDLSKTNPISGLSANIKSELLTDESSNAKFTAAENGVKDVDVTTTTDKMKEDVSIDASSDKENLEITNLDTEDECMTVSESGIKVEKMETDEVVAEAAVKQSTICVKEETSNSSDETFNETTTSNELMMSVTNDFLANPETMQTFANGLLCGRGLWSDLSVFANQPILFGRSILGWSDMNSYTYSSAALTDVSNCSRNSEETASSSTATTIATEHMKERACLFCMEYYCSHSCLFYATSASNAPLDVNSVCLCCGGDEDDDEQQEEPEEEDDKTPVRVPNTNPGWFGKGYKKKIKTKRR